METRTKTYYAVTDNFGIVRLTGCTTIAGARVEARLRGFQHVAASYSVAVRWANREIRAIERETAEIMAAGYR